MKKNRQNSNNRTDDMANCDDIVVAIGNDLSVAEKVAELEAKFAMYEIKICSIQADMTKTSDRITQVESENVSHNVQLGLLVDEAMRKKSCLH